jgi:hypothetical protein
MKHQDSDHPSPTRVKLGSIVKFAPPPIPGALAPPTLVPDETFFTVVSNPRSVTDFGRELLVVDLMTVSGEIVEAVPYDHLGIVS